MKSTAAVQTAALPSYGGYEYQILVTVWIALELIVRHRRCEFIDIEPATQEDIAAQLQADPAKAVTTLHSHLPAKNLQVQVKLRAEPLGASDFAGLLKTEPRKAAAGPAPRTRALDLLASDPTMHYLLVTSSDVTSALGRFVVTELGEDSGATSLPQEAPASPGADEANLAGRIGILKLRLERLLVSEVEATLAQVGHVPVTRVADCRRALQESVRDRLLGRSPRAWPRPEIERTLAQHDGLRGQDPALYCFVPPTCYPEISGRLSRSSGAVLLLGAPGVGKSATAERLIEDHRTAATPFEIVRASVDTAPADIRKHLSRPGPVLLYLEDPWGAAKLGAHAGRWIEELPRMLAALPPDKRILVTSRTAVLATVTRSPGHALDAHAVQIREEHYPLEVRGEVLDRWLRGATRWQVDWVDARRDRILQDLTRPQSIAFFVRQLRRLTHPGAANLERLVHDSTADAIGATVVREIRELDAVPSALALWAVLATGRPLSLKEAEELTLGIRRARGPSRTDLPKLMRFLEEGGGLTRVEGRFQAHPSVLEALAGLREQEVLDARETLDALFEALVPSDEIAVAARILKGLHAYGVRAPSTVATMLDAHLRDRALDAPDEEFDRLASEAADLTTDSDPVNLLLRCLYGERTSTHLSERHWEAPSWTSAQQAGVAASANAQAVARRFIRLAMPDAVAWYKTSEFLALFEMLHWDLSADFAEAARRTVGHDGLATDVIWAGALAGASVPFDTLLQAILDAKDDADAWWAGYSAGSYRRARQAEFDVAYCGHVFETPGGRFTPLERTLALVVAKRREREGYGWLLTHPRRDDLVEPWADSVPSNSGEAHLDELRALRDHAPPRLLHHVWTTVGRARCLELRSDVAAFVAAASSYQLKPTIDALFTLLDPSALGAELWARCRAWIWPRRAALVLRGQRASILRLKGRGVSSDDHRAVMWSLLTEVEGAVLNRCFLPPIAKTGSTPAPPTTHELKLLRELAHADLGELTARACLALAHAGHPATGPARAMLAADDVEMRSFALRAAIAVPSERSYVVRALEDTEHHCRLEAIAALADTASSSERASILRLAGDPSGPVREACAQAIGAQQWEEGLPLLVDLLRDRRNTNPDVVTNEAMPAYGVAREAADAFAHFKHPLPTDVVKALISFIESGAALCDDLAVHHKLLFVVSREAVPEILPLLERLLSRGVLMGPPEQTTSPLQYAAAWGVSRHLHLNPEARDRANTEILRVAATHSDTRIANPSLIALAQVFAKTPDLFREVILMEETTPERTLMLAAASAWAGTPIPAATWAPKLSADHPGLRVIAWAFEPDEPDEDAWLQRIAHDEVAKRWLEGLKERKLETAALRTLLRRSRHRAHFADLPDDDLHEGEIFEGIPILTLYTMTGGR